MVIYIKFFSEDDEPVQFTTALEAKEHVRNDKAIDQDIYIAVAKEPVEDLRSVVFSMFKKVEDAEKKIDELVANPDSIKSEIKINGRDIAQTPKKKKK